MVVYFPRTAFVQLVLLTLLLSAIATLAAGQAKPGCQDRCGNVSIPYPFGIGDRCYINADFDVTCRNSTPFLGTGNLQITNISIDGELEILGRKASQCYGQSGLYDDSTAWLRLANYRISNSKNKFVVIGCDSYGYLKGNISGSPQRYRAGCISTCYQRDYVDDKACSGTGCCQMDIPYGLYYINLTAYSFYNHTQTLDFSPCTYSLVVETGKFKFTSEYLNMTDKQFPVVLDWAIDNSSSNNSACQEHARSYTRDHVQGYLCRCEDGYRGNPYLPYPGGCQDIDECQDPNLNGCEHKDLCNNTMGSYTCSCPKGHHGDGRKNGERCADIDECQDPSLNDCLHKDLCNNAIGDYTCSCPKGYHGKGKKHGEGCASNRSLWAIIFVGISAGISVLLVFSSFLYFGIHKRKTHKLREKHFIENGGQMLRQILSNIEGSVRKTKIFTEEELKKATNNFNRSEIVGQGGFGTVFKGNIDGTAIAIKRSKVLEVDHKQIEQFINELIILSQIDHPNVVKLIGCCLETPVPLLVYEFITNKDLNYHLHKQGVASSIPWETRLKIAVETARAIAHMHSDLPIQIIHRDVKSANILLDCNFTAKVSDFGVSRLVPLDQTQLSTVVQGTWGYMDPEYFQSGMLNEKSDVYSFGVVLAELLTGQDVVSANRPDKDKSLATYFISTMKDDCLFEIIDKRVMEEADPEQLKRVAELAKQCLRSRGEKRPTMKDVKWTLEEIRTNKSNQVEVVIDSEETQPLLSPLIHMQDTGTSIKHDSLNSFAIENLASGR